MKRFFNNTEKRNFAGFEVLSAGEMLKVRGGNNTKPNSREKDMYEGDTRQ